MINRREFAKQTAALAAVAAIGKVADAGPSLDAKSLGLDPETGLKAGLFRFPHADWDRPFVRVVAQVPIEYVDLRGEIQLVSGLDLSRFKANPVIIGGREGKGPPIGQSDWITTRHVSLLVSMRIKRDIALMMRDSRIQFVNTGWIAHEITKPTLEEHEKFGRALKQVTRRWELILIQPVCPKEHP